MIEQISEHSIDTSLLHPEANILDVGCRNWEFTQEMLKRGYNVCPVDIDKLDDVPKGIFGYYQCAIGGEDKMVGVKRNPNDPQATMATEGEDVKMFTIATFTELIRKEKISNLKYWNVIKLDIEGAEYEAIMAMDKAYARQMSIEFHLHTGIYNIYDVRKMEEKLKSIGYTAVKHEMTSEHGAGLNYWDSLFIFDYKNL